MANRRKDYRFRRISGYTGFAVFGGGGRLLRRFLRPYFCFHEEKSRSLTPIPEKGAGLGSR